MAIPDSTLSNLTRTMKSLFRIGDVAVKDSAGTLQARTGADGAFADIQGKDVIVSVNGHTMTLQGAAGLASDLTFVLPSADGSDGDMLVTNGSGTLSFATPSSAPNVISAHTETFSEANAGAAVDITTPSSGATVKEVVVVVDTTAATTASTLSVGDETDPDKFCETTDIDLSTAGQYVLHPNLTVAAGEKLQFTVTQNASETFSGSVHVSFAVEG